MKSISVKAGLHTVKAVSIFLLLAAAISFSGAASADGTGGPFPAWTGLLFEEHAARQAAERSAFDFRPEPSEITSRPTLLLFSTQSLQLNESPLKDSAEDGSVEIEVNKRAGREEVLAGLQDVYNYKIILDISPEPVEFIPGAISIPYTDFLSDGSLKTAPEMAAVLGQSGISRYDAVLIYGECQPCGGGPSAASYVYWIMKYLGHRNVSLLDGGLDDWVKAGKPTAARALDLQPVNYTFKMEEGLLASYPFVKSGDAQIIDARSPEEFLRGSIPSSINIPYDRVLEGKRIKDDEALGHLFSSLDKKRPVVVYTNTGVKASMIWLSLTFLAYDASIYSWRDWQANSTSF